jgi:hypothetical protein
MPKAFVCRTHPSEPALPANAMCSNTQEHCCALCWPAVGAVLTQATLNARDCRLSIAEHGHVCRGIGTSSQWKHVSPEMVRTARISWTGAAKQKTMPEVFLLSPISVPRSAGLPLTFAPPCCCLSLYLNRSSICCAQAKLSNNVNGKICTLCHSRSSTHARRHRKMWTVRSPIQGPEYGTKTHE